MFVRLLALTFALLVAPAFAQQTKPGIQMGLSNEVIEITSSFDGTDILVFGSIERPDAALLAAPTDLGTGRYDVVIVLSGPTEEIIVRRKEKRLGIWINGAWMRFGDVPSSYAYATTRPLYEIAEAGDVKILQIGLENLSVVPTGGNVKEAGRTADFRESLARLKVDADLYAENVGGVQFLSPTLFKAELPIPANVPIGSHTARAFLFADGKLIDAQFDTMDVKKIGFEQFTYDMAHENGLLYGLIAVIVAIITGWTASVILRKD